MPHPCKNYEYCKGMAGNSSPLCPDCREAARELDRAVANNDDAIEQEYRRLTTKPSRYDKEKKAGLR